MKRFKIVPWWKIDNLLMTTSQLRECGLYGENIQLKLWIEGVVRKA